MDTYRARAERMKAWILVAASSSVYSAATFLTTSASPSALGLSQLASPVCRLR